MNICLYCGEKPVGGRGVKFCSVECGTKHKSDKAYENYLNNPEEYNRGNYTPKQFKNRFIQEQDNKCAICSCEPIHNNKHLVFVIDHIDGDASNNKRDNIRMVCPNCDSQLDTFKSKNKNSTRRNYWREKIKREIE